MVFVHHWELYLLVPYCRNFLCCFYQLATYFFATQPTLTFYAWYILISQGVFASTSPIFQIFNWIKLCLTSSNWNIEWCLIYHSRTIEDSLALLVESSFGIMCWSHWRDYNGCSKIHYCILMLTSCNWLTQGMNISCLSKLLVADSKYFRLHDY